MTGGSIKTSINMWKAFIFQYLLNWDSRDKSSNAIMIWWKLTEQSMKTENLELGAKRVTVGTNVYMVRKMFSSSYLCPKTNITFSYILKLPLLDVIRFSINHLFGLTVFSCNGILSCNLFSYENWFSWSLQQHEFNILHLMHCSNVTWPFLSNFMLLRQFGIGWEYELVFLLYIPW